MTVDMSDLTASAVAIRSACFTSRYKGVRSHYYVECSAGWRG
jgi:hypothetical protein